MMSKKNTSEIKAAAEPITSRRRALPVVPKSPVVAQVAAGSVKARANIDPRLVVCTVRSLSEYVQTVGRCCAEAATPLWFRGISKDTHRLVPSLFRGFGHHSEQELREREAALNRRFRDRSMPFSPQGRDESADTTPVQSWWRLFTMQHYGVPTRLLDWSENAVTALCFAVFGNGAESGDAVVWMLNPGTWNRRGNMNLRAPLSVDEHLAWPYAPLPSTHQHVDTHWPLAVYGMHNNPRIVLQQGTFVVFAPGRAQSMEEHALSSNNQDQSPLRAVVIARESVKQIAADLRSLGFITSSLYPDLGGLASDLKNDFGY